MPIVLPSGISRAMRIALLAGLPTLSAGLAFEAAPREAPIYSALSIVNAADSRVEPLAPNTIASIYGRNLAYGTKQLTPDEMHGGVMPTVLPGTGTRILIADIAAWMYYVSPTQINFLVPQIARAPALLPGTVSLQLVIDGSAGPTVRIQLAATSPALFQLDLQNAVATRADGSVLTPSGPAKPGDIVILYATGLGDTIPPVVDGQLATSPATLKQITEFALVLDGVRAPASAILYAGLAPGFAGLYQINFILPASTAANPEIRIGLGDTLSMPGLRLPVQP